MDRILIIYMNDGREILLQLPENKINQIIKTITNAVANEYPAVEFQINKFNSDSQTNGYYFLNLINFSYLHLLD